MLPRPDSSRSLPLRATGKLLSYTSTDLFGVIFLGKEMFTETRTIIFLGRGCDRRAVAEISQIFLIFVML
jgi:hypothetical protein